MYAYTALQLDSDFGAEGGSFPDSDSAPRNPWRKKNDRVARPMRKCGGVTRTRAPTQFAERLVYRWAFAGEEKGWVVTLVAIAKTSCSCHCGDETPSECFDRSWNDPLNLVGLPCFSIRAKGELVVKDTSKGMMRLQWYLTWYSG